MTNDATSPEQELHYRHVLVPLDGSEFAMAVLPTARALAHRFGAELHVVSVIDGHRDEENREVLRAYAIEALGGDVAGDRVHVVVGDDTADAIDSTAADLGDSLVCMSTHGHGRVAGSIVGSVARSVLERAGRPVVVVGPAAAHPSHASVAPKPLSTSRLVACVDGGEASEAVLPVATAWARALGMELTILTVAEPVPAPVRPEGSWHRHHGPDVDADRYVADLAARWQGAAEAVDAVAVYDPIGPADGLEAHLEERPAGLVAVTTHARSGARRLLLGAGAAAIVSRSAVPVLVAPLSES